MKWARISHPALGEHEKGKYRKYEANDGNKIVHSIHFGGPTLSAGHDRHISRFPMLDCKPKLLSKTSLRRLNGKKVRLSASRRLDIDASGLIPTKICKTINGPTKASQASNGCPAAG